MRIKLLYFAVLRDLVGKREEVIEIEQGADISAMLAHLGHLQPRLAGLLDRVAVAVNHQYATNEQILKEGDEVALLPPVSGGSGEEEARAEGGRWEAAEGRLCLTDAPLELAAVSALVEREGAGAIVSFSGAVRRESQGRIATHLDYEAYAPMVLTQMQRVIDEALEQWPQALIAIHHRIGRLFVGELAVVIAVSTPHRKEAFAACSFTIDRLKAIVPIWKKEHFTDGTSWVGWGP